MQVSSGDAVEAYLHDWDIDVTEKHLKQYEQQRDKRNAEAKAFIEKEEKRYYSSFSASVCSRNIVSSIQIVGSQPRVGSMYYCMMYQ